LPLSGEELRSQLGSAAPSDFARSIRARFPRTPLDRLCDGYAEEVARASGLLAMARSLGVTVVHPAGLPDLARLTERFHVISVLAHAPGPEGTGHLEPAIELSDGLHFAPAVRAAISPRFDGVLDLSTCTSIALAEALKQARHDYLAVATVRPTHPKLRLLLYELHLRELSLSGRPVLFTRVLRAVADGLALVARS
jgi:hypothetical protein